MMEPGTETVEVAPDNVLDQLAQLSPIEYDKRRDEAARDLGIRVSTVDTEVRKRRAADESDISLMADVEPWDDPVDGTELLDALVDIVNAYVVTPAAVPEAIALWILHSHCIDTLDVSPILGITSPEKRCGKSTLLDLLQALCQRAVTAGNITPAALFRTIERYEPTLLIDEADTFLRDNDELRGVLNSGNARRTAKVIRTVGDHHEPQAFSTFCPRAIALIGRLPDTLADRAIPVQLRRKLPSDRTARLSRQAVRGIADMKRQCARWAADHAPVLEDADPQLPDGLHDRAADNWRPLVAIADRAGGAWPERARKVAVTIATNYGEDDSIHTQLLADIREVLANWEGEGRPFQGQGIPSTILCERLARLEDSPWAEFRRGKPISAAQLSRRLGPFGVVSRTIRFAGSTAKGYPLEALQDAFERYLPPHPGFKNVTPSHSSSGAGCDGFESVTSDPPVTFLKTSHRSGGAGRDGVTFLQGAEGREGEYQPGTDHGVEDEDAA